MEIIDRYFSRYGYRYCDKFSTITEALLKSGSSSTGVLATQISNDKKTPFKTADMFIYRLLSDKNFQIDDSFWRCYTNMVFDFLKEKGGLKYSDSLKINVDYTTINDDFLILCASVVIADEKAIMLYFSSRNYPKKKNQMDQKKMEQAFINALKHILPKKYKYTIVADRGFGNSRFIDLCEKHGFDYLIRSNDNLIIKHNNTEINLKELQGQNKHLECTVKAWYKKCYVTVKTENGKTWYLLSNLDSTGLDKVYKARFKIEKLFQDLKTSGYNIESVKIKKYDRMKKLFFLVGMAHALTTFLGHFAKYVKKNFANHWDVAKVFLELEKYLHLNGKKEF